MRMYNGEGFYHLNPENGKVQDNEMDFYKTCNNYIEEEEKILMSDTLATCGFQGKLSPKQGKH